MNLMISAMKKRPKKCPSLHEIELFVIHDLQRRSNFPLGNAHIKSCVRCKIKYQKLALFYKELDRQLSYPVSSQVINFVQHLEQNRMSLLILELKPIQTNTSDYSIFRTKIIENESQLKASTGSHNQVIVRIIQNANSKSGCFTVMAEDTRFYHNVELQFLNARFSIFTNNFGYGTIGFVPGAEINNEIIKIIPHHRSS